MALSTEEEESLESIKRWWRESGRSLAMGIVAVALVYFGWQAWQASQTRSAAEASAVYDQLSQLMVTPPGEMVPEADRESAQALVARLKTDHADSVYALYGALFGARLAAEADDLATAEQELQWLLDNTQSGLFGSTDATLVMLAQLRLGRVLLANGEPDRAMSVISGVEPSALSAEFDELRGDIYLAQGQREQALAAYESAQAAAAGNPILQMKLTELQGSL
ncbi:MAG: tetratricopeptide repeat protein [Pseudohongiella sp.]|uniref:YfgM family protein n=1 Tax=Pseudohongiella sp. TaxID=1979412 RepID=UPI0034A07685